MKSYSKVTLPVILLVAFTALVFNRTAGRSDELLTQMNGIQAGFVLSGLVIGRIVFRMERDRNTAMFLLLLLTGLIVSFLWLMYLLFHSLTFAELAAYVTVYVYLATWFDRSLKLALLGSVQVKQAEANELDVEHQLS